MGETSKKDGVPSPAGARRLTPGAALELALEHRRHGRLREAEAICRRILEALPDHAEAVRHLGLIVHGQGRTAEALELLRRAAVLQPERAEFHANLAVVLRASGDPAAAEAALRVALALRPDYAEALNNLANTLLDLGRRDEAAEAFRRALTLQPALAAAHAGLGRLLAGAGRTADAEPHLREAARLRPDVAEDHASLASLLAVMRRFEEAEQAYRQAIRLRPEAAAHHAGLGEALMRRQRLTEAEQAFAAALRLDPQAEEAHQRLGALLYDQGRLDEAEAAYRRALALKPDLAAAHSSLLFVQLHRGLPPARLLALHQDWARQHVPAGAAAAGHGNDRDPERRLRIGYVSPDFRRHAVSHFIAPLFAAHDRGRIELFGYAQVAHPDAVTERLRGLAHHWRSLIGLDDAAAADLVRRDGIDILVDLAGHTADNRLLTFARRPAPILVTSLGYPATTGLAAIDYFVTTAVLSPPGDEAWHTECLARLPDAGFCYEVPPDVAPAAPARNDGPITFGSFNRLSKLNPAVIAAWCEILTRVPGSRLYLKAVYLGDEGVRRRLLAAFAAHGIGADRLRLEGPSPRPEYLAGFAAIDIALDPFPYAGGTTTLDCLAMGVPVVTLLGELRAGRGGANRLRLVGLDDLVARSVPDYVAAAVALAEDRRRLAALRATLAGRFRASPICDAPRFARHLESAYRIMWRRWCAGLPPESLDVVPQ